MSWTWWRFGVGVRVYLCAQSSVELTLAAGVPMSHRSPYHTAAVRQSKHIPKWRCSRCPDDKQHRAGVEAAACCSL